MVWGLSDRQWLPKMILVMGPVLAAMLEMMRSVGIILVVKELPSSCSCSSTTTLK